MAKEFTSKSTYSLLKSNPKLTGNVKLVVDSNDNIFIESIDGSIELSRNKFKNIPLDVKNTWDSDVYNFFEQGNTANELVYAIKDNSDFFSVGSDYSKQYYTEYQMGAYFNPSKYYEEQLAFSVPTWLEKGDVPEHFVIVKVPNPVSVNTSELETPYNESVDKEIYNPNYFKSVVPGASASEKESTYFFETILKDSKIVKVFDLGENTPIGQYLRNYLGNENFPESSLQVNWDNSNKSTVNGISLDYSGFVEADFNMFDQAFPIDRTVTEFDNLVTNQFSLNRVIHPNIINMEFLFDDEEDSDYTVNRYYGFYFNKQDITEFQLDPVAFYTKKYDNLPQNRNIESISTIDIDSQTNLRLMNEDGVKLFVDYDDNYELLSSDVKGSDFLPMVYTSDNLFFDIKNSVDWGDNEIVLKDKLINTEDFKGFKTTSDGVIPQALKTNENGRSYFELSINGVVSDLELRIRNVYEQSDKFTLNQVFVGDTSLDPGTSNVNKFSLNGTQEEIALAICRAITYHSNIDLDYNISCVNFGNSVIIFTDAVNEYFNNYEFLLFSKDSNVETSISVNLNDLQYEDIFEYNKQRIANNQDPFLDYNSIVSGDTSMAYDESFRILQANFKGGNNEANNRVRIPVEFFDFFDVGSYLKSTNWYSQIVSVSRYLDEPIYSNGIIVGFQDFAFYLTINCDGDIYIGENNTVEIYNLATNRVILPSIYPTRQFDVDQFRSDYGRDGDGYIDLVEENFMSKVGATAMNTLINVESNIQNFKDTGFKRLAGIIDEFQDTIPKITNEYNRLNENELGPLAIKGRIIPFINKWVYDDEGTDVRDNNYRLTNNSAFSYDNFTPSPTNQIPDFRFFTHEWYYLQTYPPYLSNEQKINSFSYFNDYLNKDDLYSITNDNFTDYFTEFFIRDVNDASNFIYYPRKNKYTILSGGNDDQFAETFFRGAKLLFKRRIENETPLNFNSSAINTLKSDEFNGYKFSCVLTNNTNEPLKYSFIENKKFKHITFFIEANIDDYYLTRYNGELFLDRSVLYVINDKYNTPINGEPQIADVQVNGAISPYKRVDGSLVPAFNKDKFPGFFEIEGFINTSNNSIPAFNRQILPTPTGVYNNIEVVLPNNNKVIIRGISSITQSTIIAREFVYQTSTSEEPFTNYYQNKFPTFEDCVSQTPTYFQGGINYFNATIEDLSFASIFSKVNIGSPEIVYTSIEEDGTVVENDFIVEMSNQSLNGKSDYIKTEPIIFNGVRNSDFKPIGSRTTALDKTYITPIYRHNGRYNPKAEDVIFFKEDFGDKFTGSIRENLRFKNINFFSTYPGFAEYKQLYYTKINEQSPLTVLDLSSRTALNPEYWKIGEIAIDKKDQYIFRSNWDLNYYNKYNSKVDFTRFPGYISPVEVNSFLASTVMNIPDEQLLQKYTFDTVVGSDIQITNNTNSNVSGNIFNQKKLIELITPELLPLFNEYVNPRFNFKRLDTFNDDINDYIFYNILPRYTTLEIRAYVRYTAPNSDAPIIESDMTEQELLQNGFSRLDTFNTKKLANNDFDYSFVFNKPTDRNSTLAFATYIIIK